MKKELMFWFGLCVLLTANGANASIATFNQSFTASSGYFAWSPSYSITQYTNNDGTPYSYPIPIYDHIFDDGAQKSQYYLIFNNIFGNGANQIPLGSIISNAHLDFFVYQYTPSNLGTISVYQITNDEFYPTNRLGGAFKPTKGYPDSTSKVNKSNAMSFDVSVSLNNWSRGEANYGWVLRQVGQVTRYSYESYSTTSLGSPQLVVDYSTPVPLPNAILLLGSGLIGLVGLSRR